MMNTAVALSNQEKLERFKRKHTFRRVHTIVRIMSSFKAVALNLCVFRASISEHLNCCKYPTFLKIKQNVDNPQCATKFCLPDETFFILIKQTCFFIPYRLLLLPPLLLFRPGSLSQTAPTPPFLQLPPPPLPPVNQ